MNGIILTKHKKCRKEAEKKNTDPMVTYESHCDPSLRIVCVCEEKLSIDEMLSTDDLIVLT